jgi:hypothetical protein
LLRFFAVKPVAQAIEERWTEMHRENVHAAAGILTLRYNWADISGRACTVARQVGETLQQRGTDVKPSAPGGPGRAAARWQGQPASGPVLAADGAGAP